MAVPELIALSAAKRDVPAHVEKIELAPNLKRRLTELGFTNGAAITPLYESSSGDVRAYCIRRTVIALRRSDAEKIYVTGLLAEV